LQRFLAGTSVTAVPLGELGRISRMAERDGFQIEEEIGRGPRSTVYRAVYSPLGQPVALKVFRPGVCTRDEWEARMGRSADHWRALTHPQIVPVHGAGWWDDSPYVAVEFAPAGSLAGKLTGRPLAVQEAVRIVEQVSEIISFIHRQGLVHGNLKPCNI